jgi:hypothetical protein
MPDTALMGGTDSKCISTPTPSGNKQINIKTFDNS